MASHQAAPQGQPADHAHHPGGAHHDDHDCDIVKCSVCGTPGHVRDNGDWADLDPAKLA